MKARLTTVLSLSGVLVAGSAAALVNTQVLQSRSTSGSSASETITTDTIATETTGAVDTTMAPETTVAEIPASVSTQAIYQIGDAGSVTLDTAGDVLTIVATTPNLGWTVAEAENSGPLNVEVKFESATMKIEFKANLLFGVVSTSVESESVGSDDQGDDQDDDSHSTTPGSGSTYQDDDDEHDDDEHDDDDGDEHDDDDGDEHDDD